MQADWSEELPEETEAAPGALEVFLQTLEPDDRRIMDDLLQRAEQHQPAIRAGGEALPAAMALLVMLLEEHKEVQRLKRQVETNGF